MRKAPTPSTVNGAFQDHHQRDDFTLNAQKAVNHTGLLIARLALAGHVVHRGPNRDFTVCKYGMSRYCKDFTELQAFAKLLGVKTS